MPPKPRPPYERFIEKVKVNPETECWEWLSTTTPKGYGQFWLERKYRYSHRVSYEWHIGPIPEGLEVDHLCRVRRCVNPAHLEAVTGRENRQRGVGIDAINARKTHCYKGHEFTPENVYISPRGARICQECRRVNQRIRRKALRKANQ